MSETADDSTDDSDLIYLDEFWEIKPNPKVDQLMHELRAKGRAPNEYLQADQ